MHHIILHVHRFSTQIDNIYSYHLSTIQLCMYVSVGIELDDLDNPGLSGHFFAGSSRSYPRKIVQIDLVKLTV